MKACTRTISLRASVPDNLAGRRLDQIAAKLFPDYSRARLQTWIREGSLLVDGRLSRPRAPQPAGVQLSLDVELKTENTSQAEALPLAIVYEDEHLLVVNKSAGMVVHPAAGHREGTLLNGLLHYCPALEYLPRVGIVHRLDKDTSGLMVVAKTLAAHTDLVRQLQERAVLREYEAVVLGVLTGGGTVDAPLGRHPVHRKKRAVVRSGQEAITHYRVLKRYRHHTHIQVRLETGRTHQIRVHMAYLKHPLVGDPVYAGRLQIPATASPGVVEQLTGFRRQALHARRLSLMLPGSGLPCAWEASLPEDMLTLLEVMAADASDSETE